MSTNVVKKNNVRDLGFGYLLVLIIYSIIGIFGTIGIIGSANFHSNPSTILQYFNPGDIPPFIVEVVFTFYLLTVFPFFCYFSKCHAFYLAFGD
jgi:sodium-coupled neutral amino acid transporter 9